MTLGTSFVYFHGNHLQHTTLKWVCAQTCYYYYYYYYYY